MLTCIVYCHIPNSMLSRRCALVWLCWRCSECQTKLICTEPLICIVCSYTYAWTVNKRCATKSVDPVCFWDTCTHSWSCAVIALFVYCLIGLFIQCLVCVLQEICLLRMLSFDPNMVQFYGACLDPGFPMLVLEYMQGGDLLSCIQHDCYPTPIGEFKWYKKGGRIALDVAKGMVFMHEQKASDASYIVR